MDTLAQFFDIRKASGEMFDGLDISKKKDLCNEWMNQWPVIFLTLKEADGLTFEMAQRKLATSISDLYIQHTYLLKSNKVDMNDRKAFETYHYNRADETELQNALFLLMRMMYMHFGKKVIILIDEYDVPLAKANEKGYYKEMLNLVQGLMSKTLKTNPYLKFAVVTGCLRIAKQSIFTGTNNFVSDTITGTRFNEYFGFTNADVKKLLFDTGLENRTEEIRRWYDGYRFGTVDIYCPWDVLNHVNAVQDNPDITPKSYWEDTSHNGVLRTFIELANGEDWQDLDINEKFETLLAGGFINQPIEENLTYDTLYSTESNLWSLLYLTGYLTQAAFDELPEDVQVKEGDFWTKIPNEEVKAIFKKTVVAWFQAKVRTIDRSELFLAMWNGDEEKATKLLSDLLFDTISYYDYREDFYHAFIAGVFTGAGYAVKSNREAGLGRTDLVIRDKNRRRAMIIEAKRVAEEKLLEAGCTEAVKQIDEKRYADEFSKGYRSVICYGIAFYDKECLVKKFGTVEK